MVMQLFLHEIELDYPYMAWLNYFFLNLAVPILVVIISVVALLPGVGFTIFEAYGITRAIT